MFRSPTTYALAAFTALSFATSAQAVPYAHVDQLASRLEAQTKELHREADLHFRQTPLYQHLHQDIVQMQKLARHIHDVVHNHGTIEHLRADVNQLDRLFHHIEGLVGRLALDPRIDNVTIQHFSRELAGINVTLHHLQSDLRPVRRPVCEYEALRPNYGVPVRTQGYAVPVRTQGYGSYYQPARGGYCPYGR